MYLARNAVIAGYYADNNSLLALIAPGLRVAASFNRPITSELDHNNENS